MPVTLDSVQTHRDITEANFSILRYFAVFPDNVETLIRIYQDKYITTNDYSCTYSLTACLVCVGLVVCIAEIVE